MSSSKPLRDNDADSLAFLLGQKDAAAILAPLVDSLETGVLLIDAHNHISLVSRPFASVLGLEPSAVQAMSPAALMEHIAGRVDDPPQLLSERKLLPGDGVVCEEFQLERPTRTFVRWVARRVDAPYAAVVVTCTDITTETDLANRLEELAVLDRLTGLANRRGMEQALRRELVRARRYGSPLSVAMVDLDRFKEINDAHGHDMGDWVLQRVAATVSSQLRETDMVARWGGEEFLILLASTPLEAARVCGERIRVAVARMPVPLPRPVTVSVGVIDMGPAPETAADMVGRAEAILQEAKRDGRNRVR